MTIGVTNVQVEVVVIVGLIRLAHLTSSSSATSMTLEA
jgi:hypothetical protein